jgi:hypothetical protein
MTDLKPVTVRLPHEDFILAEREAASLGVGVGVYLRILVRQSLRNDERKAKRAASLLHFSREMAKETEQKVYSEEDVLAITKQARTQVSAKRRKSS